MIPGNASPLLLATAADAAAAADVATKSLRFNSGDSSSLTRTPSSAGNRKTFTFSCWVKRTKLGGSEGIFDCRPASGSGMTDSNLTVLYFDTDNELKLSGAVTEWRSTTQVFRDTSSFYHIVLAVDTTSATAADRIKLYVNGSEVTDFGSNNNPSQNHEFAWNLASKHAIGSNTLSTPTGHINAYLTDIYFIDGSQLDATSFGAFDDNGVWQAAAYSGTFGTNGFHLKFADASSDSALGTDSSGNSNTFTVNNITAKSPGDYDSPKHFDVITYSGTGSEQTISKLNFKPDLVWIKNRNNTTPYSHQLVDSVRGKIGSASSFARLASNLTAVEATPGGDDGVTALTSNGFTVLGDESYNNSGDDYVAWCWKAGGTASSNTDGTITSSVSANAAYGFSIVTWNGTGAAATIGHGLSAAPKMIIVKNRDGAYNWAVGHDSIGWTKYLYLNTTDAEATSAALWNDTAPTSSVFSVKNSSASNRSGDDMVAYCWSEISSFSKFGTYSGGTNPNTIVTGFKPRFVLIKRTDSTASHYVWMMYDSARGGTKKLAANYNSEENEASNIGDDASNVIEFVSNGFKHTKTNAATNASGGTYIYMAFAGTPAGEEDDSLFDVPTNGTQSDTGAGGEVSGNYATLNPLAIGSDATLSNGNLDVSYGTGSTRGITTATIGMSSGKWYWEATFTASSATNTDGAVGITTTEFGGTNYPGHQSTSWGYLGNGNKYNNGSGSSYGDTFGANDVIGIAFDADGGNLYFYKNGVAQNSGTAAYTSLTSGPYYAAVGDGSTNSTFSASFNFGQREFAFDAPSGYKALNTASLSAATIADGTDYFASPTWTGDGGSSVSVTTGFEPDLIWIKQRNKTYYHQIYDAVRGYGSGKALASNENVAEGYGSPAQYGFVSATSSTGFTGSEGSGTPLYVNENNTTYVAWCWDAGSSTASNTDGSITSNVRANQTAGFSIVSWTGTGSAGTIGHGLNSAPELIIGKNRGNTTSWIVGAAPANDWSKVLFLNTTDALTTNGNFNSTAPTSSVFSVGTGSGLNQNTYTHTAYCISAVAGFSDVGSWVGNGSSDGPFVFTGFRPAFLMWKLSSASGGNWNIEDSGRSPINPVTITLRANTTEADLTTSQGKIVDFLSNGFQVRNTSGQHNTSGATYIYWAVAENPFTSNGGLAR